MAPVTHPFDATVLLPGSKSITNRALILAAMAHGDSILTGALCADDTRAMADALNKLGIHTETKISKGEMHVSGQGGVITATTAELQVGNAGTAARFLCAFCSVGNGEYIIDGNVRMRERPITDLVKALASLGVDIKSVLNTGCVPVRIMTSGCDGGTVNVNGETSSQFASALMLAAPSMRCGLSIEVLGQQVSKPYTLMTAAVMRSWGLQVECSAGGCIRVPGVQYIYPRVFAIEPDASAASYFMAAAAITHSRITIPGLGSRSIQGDTQFAKILSDMGASVNVSESAISVTGTDRLAGVDVDMNGISDTVMTLAAIAPFADSPTTIRNVANTRFKETDRLAATATELTRLGVRVVERSDGLTIYPTEKLNPARIQTYSDHRMAMSFAVTGLRSPGITILNPSCVAKTFPAFFKTLEEACNSGGA